MEQTFIIIKPNGVSANIIGKVLDRYETSRLAICSLKMIQPSIDQIKGFYQEHIDRPFFSELLKFMTSGPIVLVVLQGEKAVSVARELNGATDPSKAVAGTIRYDFAPNTGQNVVHSSDSCESANREIEFWFNSDEFFAHPSSSSIL